MSNRKGILGGLLALAALAREIAALWRESEPEPRKADRSAFDALRDQIEGSRSKQ